MDIHAPKSAGNPPESYPYAPGNIEVEQGLLGAFLMWNEAVEWVPDLAPEHFLEPLHGDIFEAIVSAINSGRAATATTLSPRFRNVAIDETTNGAQYLGRLLVNATTAASVRTYARDVIEAAQRRTLIVVAEDLIASCYEPNNTNPAELVEKAETALFRVSTRGRDGRAYSLAQAAKSAVEAINRAHKLGGKIDGIATGFRDIDNKLGGFGNGDLVVLGGRPSMGKTALAVNIAINVARGTESVNPKTGELENVPGHVHFFSQEMTAQQLAMRQLGERSGIPSDKLRRGEINESQLRDVLDAASYLSSLPMEIDETGGLTIAAISAMARREKRKNNTKLIVVDYLQLMRGAGKSQGNRVQDITEITTGLKALGKELGVPILALSQLSRKVEERDDKRPQMADLRESGSIEQDADIVLFVYREEYYVERKKPAETSPEYADWCADIARTAGKAEVIIGKQRHGAIGIVDMAFDGALTRFSCLARDGGGQ